jgi:4,5-dihydroxyphthalate decarboxylase
MSRPVTVVLGNYAHTKAVKSRTELASVAVSFPGISPVHTAFHDMVRAQRYDVCEMALATFLQAREAGKPLLLLPVVMVGGFHHGNLRRSPDSPLTDPRALRGSRVGVRAYTTTMGLWTRSVLDDEYGVEAAEVSWVTNEDPHVAEYREPGNVIRAEEDLLAALSAGRLAAAIVNGQENPGLPAVIPDPADAAMRWFGRHGTVPINHMVVVTRQLLESAPEVVRALYGSLVDGIDSADLAPADGSAGRAPSPIRHGRASVRTAIELGIRAARRQRLVHRDIDDFDGLFAI